MSRFTTLVGITVDSFTLPTTLFVSDNLQPAIRSIDIATRTTLTLLNAAYFTSGKYFLLFQ
jgi:hypothetical protein